MHAALDETMFVDRHALRQRLSGIAKMPDDVRDASLAHLMTQIDRSRNRFLRRRTVLPSPTFPPELPVSLARDEIAQAILKNQVIVLAGETGSGKTTQLPKICLGLGRGIAGMIGHTQPRRIAARTVAARIAEELGTTVGRGVGYKVRFSDHVGEDTLVKLMTDGILLAETQNDRFLSAYDTIIIDEAHERSLNIDFLLGLLKQLLPRRPELKLIVTSATINPELFSRHFNNAPVLNVSGRTYPVEVWYRPLSSSGVSPVESSPHSLDQNKKEAGDRRTGETPELRDDEDLDPIYGILRAVDELWSGGNGPGDTLVFLPGEREIRETTEALRKHHPPQVEVLPLYARLAADEQNRIFQPHNKRRIVLATNVAETSLTVPGIKYVIDPGLARMSRYAPNRKVQRLPIEPISRASADQRKGRCGRVSAGICVRLFSEADFNSRPQYTDPEILRTNLASVILQMKFLRLGDIQAFPFVEPPDYRLIRDGFQTLHEIGAIDDRNELTDLGRHLARLPIDPRIARMILASVEENCVDEVLVIAAALSVQDPRERPMDQQQNADTAHVKFRHESSDFLTSLNLWHVYHQNARHLSHSKLRRWCKENFLSYTRLREWHDIHSQLRETVTEMNLHRPVKHQERLPTKEHEATRRGKEIRTGDKTRTGEIPV